MPESEKLKRPASHRWAIGIFAFTTAAFVIFLIDAIAGRSGASPRRYWLPIAFLSVGALALFSLIFGGRQKWAYYVTSASLATWAVRAIYTSSLYAYNLVCHGPPLGIPYFHLLERDKPFVVQQHMTLARQIMVLVVTGLTLWLFLRFTIGRQSRNYFGFYDPESHDSG